MAVNHSDAEYKQFVAHAKELGLKVSDSNEYGRLIICFFMNPNDANKWALEFTMAHGQRINVSWHVGDKFYHHSITLDDFLSMSSDNIDAFWLRQQYVDGKYAKLKEQLKQLPLDHKAFVKDLVTR